MSAIRLEDFEAGVIIEFLAGEDIGDVSADVIVTDAPRVRIAMCALPYFRRCPRPNSREAAQRPISLLVGASQGAL